MKVGTLCSGYEGFGLALGFEWVTGLDLGRTAELKMLGNGIVPQQAAAAWRILTQGEP